VAFTAGAVQVVSNTFGGPSLTGQDKLASGADTSTLAGPPAELGASLTAPTGLETTNLTDQLTLGTPVSPGIPAPSAGDITRQSLMPPAVTPVNSGVASLPAGNAQSFTPNNVPIIESAGVQGPNVTDRIGVPMKTVEPKNFFERGLDKIMPGRIENAAIETSGQAFRPAYDSTYNAVVEAVGEESAVKLAKEAGMAAMKKAANPGMIEKFGPLAAGAMGVAGLAGAFNTEEPQMPDGYEDFMNAPGQRLLDQYPERYALSFGGVRPMGSSGYQTYTPPPYKAAQGSGPSGVAQGFPRMNGPIDGPGTGTSDDVPAMLSDGEFVFTAKAVRNMGQGSRRKGAKKMYALMKKLEGTA
jgi:hypothetical protein